jgi:hypothetical protein
VTQRAQVSFRASLRDREQPHGRDDGQRTFDGGQRQREPVKPAIVDRVAIDAITNEIGRIEPVDSTKSLPSIELHLRPLYAAARGSNDHRDHQQPETVQIRDPPRGVKTAFAPGARPSGRDPPNGTEPRRNRRAANHGRVDDAGV